MLKDTSSNHKMYDENYVKKLRRTLRKTVAQNDILKKKNHKMYDKNYVSKLIKTIRKTAAQNRIIKKKFRETNAKLNAVLNKDQIYSITHDHHKGKSWSANTINKALKLYVACGQKGYEEVRQQLPYPSIRTLQSRIQGLKFKPGIFEDIFKLLEIKVSIFLN